MNEEVSRETGEADGKNQGVDSRDGVIEQLSATGSVINDNIKCVRSASETSVLHLV